MNKKKIVIFSSIIVALFFLNISIFALNISSLTNNISTDRNFFPQTSQIIPRNVRVAIYDDTNITRPSYTSVGALTNNHTNIYNTLSSAGFEVNLLTTNQIFNHELKNARYDIFIMADHLPRENITDLVKEYWLGGGSLLSMDSALSFICWAGILPPESAGDDGYLTYWQYYFSSDQNITARHPVSKSYQINDTFTIDGSISSATFDWTALQGSSIASEVVKIATRLGFPDDATVVAFNPLSAGGKVVHLPSVRKIEDDSILIDAIEWLCPRPKGRILFDLSHENGYGVDIWDNTFTHYTDNRYTIMRNNLVNHGYIFDKLYPTGSDTFTMQNLSPYDLVIVNLPDVNVSASEVNTLSNWVQNGGGLLALGDQYVFDGSKNLNYLFTPYDLQLINDNAGPTQDTSFEHPTIEGCTTLTMAVPSEVNYSNNAYPLWGSSTTDIGIAAQEYGEGRIVLLADINIFDNTRISATDNLQFNINVVNWLTASKSNTLLFVNEPWSENYYVTPAANALNDLELPFYLTYTDTYLNLSLNLYDWDLVIVDEPWTLIDPTVFDTLLDYLKTGGKLIMSTYRVDNSPAHPLWSYMGFEFSADIPDSSPVYIWNDAHSIFNSPILYGANNYTPVLDYGDEGDLLNVFPNATALAGFTESEQQGNATIVLRNDGKTLFNSYLIDQFSGDFDDSTYEDRVELWIGEIYFIYNYGASIPQGGIPGFELGIFMVVSISTIGLISIAINIKKKK
jgi:hypothetical protein